MNDLHHPSFKNMMHDVVDAGSCCECGSCVLVCPHNIIEYVDSKPKQTAKASAEFDFCGISEGVGCDVCASVCPRLWPREDHLKDVVFKDSRPYEDIFGVYKNIFTARTKKDEIMENAQDGGIVTALLSWALEKKVIDGAVVSAVGENDDPCSPSPQVVTTQKEILASSGSGNFLAARVRELIDHEYIYCLILIHQAYLIPLKNSKIHNFGYYFHLLE